MENIKKFIEFINENKIVFSDALRKDFIEEFLKQAKADSEYNIEKPDFESLLDPYDGYDKQTYIQNDLKNNKFIYYEGFSKYCWKAFKEQYKKLKKEQIIEKFINERANKLGEEFGFKLEKYDYWIEDAEDIYENSYKDYILKLIYKRL